VLQHVVRHVARDRRQSGIRCSSLRQFRDRRVPQVVEPEAGKLGRCRQMPPRCSLALLMTSGIDLSMLAGREDVMLLFGTTDGLSSFSQSNQCLHRILVQWDRPSSRIVLAERVLLVSARSSAAAPQKMMETGRPSR